MCIRDSYSGVYTTYDVAPAACCLLLLLLLLLVVVVVAVFVGAAVYKAESHNPNINVHGRGWDDV